MSQFSNQVLDALTAHNHTATSIVLVSTDEGWISWEDFLKLDLTNIEEWAMTNHFVLVGSEYVLVFHDNIFDYFPINNRPRPLEK